MPNRSRQHIVMRASDVQPDDGVRLCEHHCRILDEFNADGLIFISREQVCTLASSAAVISGCVSQSAASGFKCRTFSFQFNFVRSQKILSLTTSPPDTSCRLLSTAAAAFLPSSSTAYRGSSSCACDGLQEALQPSICFSSTSPFLCHLLNKIGSGPTMLLQLWHNCCQRHQDHRQHRHLKLAPEGVARVQ